MATTCIVPRIEIELSNQIIVLLSENFTIVTSLIDWAKSNNVNLIDKFNLQNVLLNNQKLSDYIIKEGEYLLKENIEDKYKQIYSNNVER